MDKGAWEERIKSAKDAVLRVSMTSVLSQYGIKTQRIGTQVSLTCPWCGAATGHCFIYKKDGAERVRCFKCDRNENVIGVAMLLGGMEYIEALEELTGGEFSLIGRNSDKPALAKRPAAVVEQREPEPPEIEKADADVLDAFYRAMVKATGLTTEHKNHLTKQRGLKKYRLDEYCSWPPVSVSDVMRQVERDTKTNKELARRVVEQLDRIPGLRRDDTPGFGLPGDGWSFCCTGRPGIALLSVDDLGLARGVQIRADEAKEGYSRYYWLSGGGEGRPSSGTPAGWIQEAKTQLSDERHNKVGYRCPKYRPVSCVITEGKFKAEILSQWGYNSAYVSGVGVWRGAGILDMVRRVSPEGAMVGIAYDADSAEKEQVARQREALAEALLEAGFRPVIWDWAINYGKGIDDLLMSRIDERGRKVYMNPYKEVMWREPAAKIDYAPKKTEYEDGEIVTAILSECLRRNGYDGWSLVSCRGPADDYGQIVKLERLPIWKQGAVVRAQIISEEKGLGARWRPATKGEIFELYGAPEIEPPRIDKRHRRTPERKTWEEAEKAEAATAILRVACKIYLLCRDEEKDGGTKGLPCDKIALAITKWGAEAAKFLQLNPYAYGHELGISLQACDRMKDTHEGDDFWFSEERLKWCAEWALDYSTDCGHTRVPVKEVMRRVRYYCGCEEKDPDPRLILDDCHHIDTDPDGEKVVVHGGLEHCEKAIAENLLNRHNHGRVRTLTNAGRDAMWEAFESLSDDQQKAVRTLLEGSGATVLTGGPGTGKTHVLATALFVYRKSFPDAKVKLCAPTGRAAQRLHEASKMPASTIHSMLEMNPYRGGPQVVDVDADLVVVDEVSMAEVGLVHDLLRCIPLNAQIWFCGDFEQLEPVGPGAFLYDVLAAGEGIVSVARLATIHRQREGSSIIPAGRGVLGGKKPKHNGKDLAVAKGKSAKAVVKAIVNWAKKLYDPARPFDSQVLCVTNRSKDRFGNSTPGGTNEMNVLLQKKVNPHRKDENGAWEPELSYGATVFRLRDKVILCRNKSEFGKSVYSNGDLGVVSQIFGNSMEVTLQNKNGLGQKTVSVSAEDLPDVRLAYALTTHKGQGSGYKEVLICLPACQVHKTPGFTRNLLYTAITRTERRCIIAFDGDALETAVSAPTHTRRTGLQQELRKQKRKLAAQEQDELPLTQKSTLVAAPAALAPAQIAEFDEVFGSAYDELAQLERDMQKASDQVRGW